MIVGKVIITSRPGAPRHAAQRPQFPPHLQKVIDEQRARQHAHAGGDPPAPKKTKFRSRTVVDGDGVVYESALERDVAANLEMRRQLGEIAKWTWAPRFLIEQDPATPNTLVTYRPDFIVWPLDNQPWYVIDAKGVRTATFNVKARLWKVRYPDHPLMLVRRVKGGGRVMVAA